MVGSALTNLVFSPGLPRENEHSSVKTVFNTPFSPRNILYLMTEAFPFDPHALTPVL